MESKSFDVLVVGAGASGMMAAWEISLTGKKVAIVEAASHTGGRMRTIDHPQFEKPVESGAEFVHGNLPVTLQLFKKAGIKKYKSGGDVWQYKNGGLEEQGDLVEDYKDLEKKFKLLENDIPVADFIRRYLADTKYKELANSLTKYVQGYYAGDVEKASTYALCQELTTGEEVNYRVEGGYQKLTTYLEQQCNTNGVKFYLEEEVSEIDWKQPEVEVKTNKGIHFAKNVLITASIGVLQSEAIRFCPALPQKNIAAKKLGFGHVLKINFQFKMPSGKTNRLQKVTAWQSSTFYFPMNPSPPGGPSIRKKKRC